MPRKKPNGTKAEAIRKYVSDEPYGTIKDFIAKTKIQVGESQFYTVRKETLALMNAELKKSNSTPHNTGKDDLLTKLQATEQKLDEYRYRLWKLEGEKFGYVERVKAENS